MTTRYISKTERIKDEIKKILKTYPSEPVSMNDFVSILIFEYGFKEREVIPIIEAAINLGYIEKINDKIVSAFAKQQKIIDMTPKPIEDVIDEKEINNILESAKND